MTGSAGGPPPRSEQLIRATQRVIVERGIKAVTYRLIAAEAGVPLGTATYHFPALAELVERAVTAARDHHVDELHSWFAPPVADDPAAAIADYYAASVRDHAALTADYELYLAAVSVPSMRHIAAAWFDAVAETFAQVVGDGERAAAVAALLDGCFLRAVVRGPASPSDEERVAVAVAKLLTAE